MAFILPIEEPWTSQPQVAVEVDWSNPLTQGLMFAVTPQGKIVGPAKIATPHGVAYSFDPAVPTPIDTGVKNSAVSSHSGVIFCRHPLMSLGRLPNYMGCRVSANNGWAFYQSSAASSFPDQLFKLGYVHGGVAGYSMPSDIISGFNTQFGTLGFSATVSGNLSFYVRGQSVYSTSIAGISQSSDTIRIGRDVYFSSQPADYEMPFSAYWNRRLSDTEHELISSNPWQIFAP